MAQPPEIGETFVREVDENLRRDQMRDFGKKYGGWIVAAVVLFLAASGGYIYWRQYQAHRSEKQVEQLAEVYRNVAAGKTSAAPPKLDELAGSRSKAIRASALFTRAAIALQDNDPNLATAKYREIAGDDALPQPYRDIALIRQTSLEFDRLKPEEVIARMAPLAKPGNPWFGSAGEMTAAALIKQGKKAQAGQLYAAMVKDKTVPDSIRARSIQMASSLGVDAGSGLGAIPAQ